MIEHVGYLYLHWSFLLPTMITKKSLFGGADCTACYSWPATCCVATGVAWRLLLLAIFLLLGVVAIAG